MKGTLIVVGVILFAAGLLLAFGRPESSAVKVCREDAQKFALSGHVKTGQRWPWQNRPTVAMAKPANGDGPGLGCFTLQSPPPASLFLCASCVDRI
jgi:hypothetical protein